MKILSREECLNIFVQTDVYVSYQARACTYHWENNTLIIPPDFQSTFYGIEMSSDDIIDFITTMKKAITNERKRHFSFLSMEEKLLEFETGLNYIQFKHILSFLPEDINVRNREFALGVYFSRLRRGYTYEELAVRWNITRQTASTYCSTTRSILKNDFLNTYLGMNVSREEILDHQDRVTNLLHVPNKHNAAFIFDATYIFIEKSTNFSFQKSSYSSHKKRNLIKPFMIIYPDAFILDVKGSYPGNINDASIMNDLLTKNIWEAFEPGDVFLVDRGFRDSISLIEEKGYIPKMPSFADSPNKSLTTEQANQSRLITKSRYVVEYVNGKIKKEFNYFNSAIRNTTLTYVFDDFKIACATYNCRFNPIRSNTSNEIIKRMLQKVHEKNKLSDLVLEKNLN